MIFEADAYFKLKDKESQIKVQNYNSCFMTGILICPKLLYYLLLGDYYDKIKNASSSTKITLSETERISYVALKRLLTDIQINTNHPLKIFITPHIFTKLVHELLENKRINKNNFGEILDLFKEDFSYIQEEVIRKEEIIDFSHFRNTFLGISETVLLIMKNRRNLPCILAESGKIFSEYKSDFLLVNFNELISFVKEEERKNILI